MELSPKQQIAELLRKSNNILITTHINPDGDALGACLAISLVLKKMGKSAQIAVSGKISDVLSFLPDVELVETNFNGTKDFVVSVDMANAKIDRLSYKKIDDNKLNIIITPKNGNFSPEDVSFFYGDNKFDLILVLDAPDLDRLGEIYDNNTDLFYETPIVNIDHHPGNEYFGKINWVELTATSTSEILVSLIESLSREKQLIDENIATCLLTGITTDTGSFQNTNTTPKSLTVAAQLVALGARQQEIIQKIYKTKTLTTLKLWGVILAKITRESENFVWSSATLDDFANCGASETQTQGVIDELLKTVPGIDFAMLLTERESGVHASIRATKKHINVSKIANLFGGGGHEQAAAFLIKGVTLKEVENDILGRIKRLQKEEGLVNASDRMLLQEDEDLIK